MNPFDTSTNSTATDWLIFVVMLLAMGVGIAGVVIWLVVLRPKSKKSRRKHRQRHQRQHNPTLAQTGGLPPKRDPNQPPASL